jgi:hypothetical protein
MPRRLFLGLSLALALSAHGADLPDGYIIHKGTESPDGRYGIAVPAADAEDSGAGENTNYLADLKTHRALGTIACDTYFEGENHYQLRAYWTPDSKYCVALYEGRYGFGSIAVLAPARSGFSESNLGERIDKLLKAAAGGEGYGDFHYRFAADRKLLVRVVYFTGNPKIEDENTRFAVFEGTFDLNSGKWTKADARPMKWPLPDTQTGECYSAAQFAAGAAYSDYTGKEFLVSPDGKAPDDFQGTIVSSEEGKAGQLDDLMNQVYQGLRALLPPERFAQVKRDQIAWLKKRDAASSATEKSKLLEARIKALQDLVW